MRRVYTDTVVDHVLNPRNAVGMAPGGSASGADGYGLVTTPEGDSIRMWLRVRDDRVVEASFWTDSCAATVASVSVITELARRKTVVEALGIGQQDVLDALGGLPEGNVHCSLLAVSALREAVRDYLAVRKEPWKRGYRRY